MLHISFCDPFSDDLCGILADKKCDFIPPMSEG